MDEELKSVPMPSFQNSAVSLFLGFKEICADILRSTLMSSVQECNVLALLHKRQAACQRRGMETLQEVSREAARGRIQGKISENWTCVTIDCHCMTSTCRQDASFAMSDAAGLHHQSRLGVFHTSCLFPVEEPPPPAPKLVPTSHRSFHPQMDVGVPVAGSAPSTPHFLLPFGVLLL